MDLLIHNHFSIGDQIYVEGIQRIGETGVGATQGGISTNTTVEGDGFNSDNYNYRTKLGIMLREHKQYLNLI